jgi:hypothetical protein
MKSWNVFGVMVVTGMVALGGASVARADDGKAVVNVPFAFMAGNSQLPAGHYVISDTGDDEGVVTITSADGRQSVYLTTLPGASSEPAATPELVFERLGGRYILSQFTLESSDGHRTLLALPSVSRQVSEVTAAAR